MVCFDNIKMVCFNNIKMHGTNVKICLETSVAILVINNGLVAPKKNYFYITKQQYTYNIMTSGSCSNYFWGHVLDCTAE